VQDTNGALEAAMYIDLVLEEVIAVRLYTGPAFIPINRFLREVAKLSPSWRRNIAQNPTCTYAATVNWLISAIRKLSILTPVRKVFRGVKSKLPPTFQNRDEVGMVSVVDFGFMSTSLDEDVAISYMSAIKPNVLWEISCMNQGDCYHNGADVSFLSQYPHEKEILFPPLTMLVACNQYEDPHIENGCTSDGKVYEKVHVIPYYV
jgi:hypothetical protein